METLTIKIPNDKSKDVSNYVKDMGGKVIKPSKTETKESDEDDEVTHAVFFGENIKRLIKAFKK